MGGAQRGLLWFRKGLRLHDNPALHQACKGVALAPVFVLDPWFLTPQRVGVNRLNFLLESLRGLTASLVFFCPRTDTRLCCSLLSTRLWNLSLLQRHSKEVLQKLGVVKLKGYNPSSTFATFDPSR